jgi:PIN domain nuclease of toxin-antitoxin system
MGLVAGRDEVPRQAAAVVILLDTNAVIWLDQDHARTRPLLRGHKRLYISPATILELQFLEEVGRIRLLSGDVTSLTEDERWVLDDPPAASWFSAAVPLTWTRDPFDRLLAAHAELRGWRLATGDARLLEHLGTRRGLAL